jgi:predicted O-methyltransferase YrrM
VTQPRPQNAYAEHNKLWESIPGFFDYQGPYSGLAADVPDSDPIVEIGSWLGKSAAYLARELQLRGKTNKVYCVDTWAGDASLMKQVAELGGPDQVFAAFLRNMRTLAGRVLPIRMNSVSAAACFEDESVAAVFIDAEHTYAAVMAELTAWYPKLLPGGLIFGHDYVPLHPVSRINVVAAVDEFFQGKNLELRPMSRVWKHVKPGQGPRIWS